MATRGVFQLTKLRLNYCEVGGSSRAMRDYLGNGRLVAWAADHPHVEIEVKRRNGQHPFVQADYITKNGDFLLPNIAMSTVSKFENLFSRRIEEEQKKVTILKGLLSLLGICCLILVLLIGKQINKCQHEAYYLLSQIRLWDAS